MRQHLREIFNLITRTPYAVRMVMAMFVQEFPDSPFFLACPFDLDTDEHGFHGYFNSYPCVSVREASVSE